MTLIAGRKAYTAEVCFMGKQRSEFAVVGLYWGTMCRPIDVESVGSIRAIESRGVHIHDMLVLAHSWQVLMMHILEKRLPKRRSGRIPYRNIHILFKNQTCATLG